MNDDNPEGNARMEDAWNAGTVSGWQAAVIRLARPALLWTIGVITMGIGPLFAGFAEAAVPGSGVRMAAAMAGVLKSYPGELYLLVAFLFGGQALASIIRAWKGA